MIRNSGAELTHRHAFGYAPHSTNRFWIIYVLFLKSAHDDTGDVRYIKLSSCFRKSIPNCMKAGDCQTMEVLRGVTLTLFLERINQARRDQQRVILLTWPHLTFTSTSSKIGVTPGGCLH